MPFYVTGYTVHGKSWVEFTRCSRERGIGSGSIWVRRPRQKLNTIFLWYIRPHKRTDGGIRMDDPLVRDVMIIVAALLAAAGAYLAHRFAPASLRENNEFTGFTFSFVGLVYGVYLAFTVVIVWEHFETADDLAVSEATRLSELLRDAGALPGGGVIQQQIYDYTRSVIDDDWPSLARDHRGSERTERKYEDLW